MQNNSSSLRTLIPFDLLDGTNETATATLERSFGETAVVFSTQQAAIQATLELLGSRETDLPVVLSIASAPDVVAAVLRAGASPFLLDIDEHTLQMQPALVKEVLESVPNAVVILDSLLGASISQELLTVCDDVPTIGLPNKLVHHGLTDKDCLCSFSIFDMSSVFGCGSLLIHRFADEVRALKLIRNGMLGINSILPEQVATHMLTTFKADPMLRNERAARNAAVTAYSNVITPDEHKLYSYYVPAVDKAIAFLHAEGIAAKQLIVPVHELPTLAERWLEQPSYPVAESLKNRILALPTHKGVHGHEQRIIELLKQIG